MTVTRTVWNQIQSNDHRLMRKFHRWRAPRWLRILTILATRLGDGWLWYALGIVLLIYGGERRFVAVGAAASAAVAGILYFSLLKSKSRRRRPCDIEPHCWSQILPPDKYSFPSGHSITAFAIAISVGLFYPELATLPAGGRAADCVLAHHPGHAFPQRRRRGLAHRRDARPA